MKRRDLLLRRYWRREDGGTYGNNILERICEYSIINISIWMRRWLPVIYPVTVILYHSVFHKKCPPQKGYVRACLKSNVCLKIRLNNLLTPHWFYFVIWYLNIWSSQSALSTGGGYVISPVNQGTQSVVKHMTAVDWKFWKSYLQPSSARSITIRMLGRIAGSFQL